MHLTRKLGTLVLAGLFVFTMLDTGCTVHARYDLDTAIQRLAKEAPGNAIGVQLTGAYHNLLRRLAEM
ncbi:MAG TPA: hypothetical protein VGI45_18110 [Terracidiphilus sp.]|jgi:PKHD-type hydroxylase